MTVAMTSQAASNVVSAEEWTTARIALLGGSFRAGSGRRGLEPTGAPTCTLVRCGGLAETENPLTYETEAAQRGHSPVGRALALQARRAGPGFPFKGLPIGFSGDKSQKAR